MKKPKLNLSAKPILDRCVTLKFKIGQFAGFLDEMADTFSFATFKMTVDATTTIITVKITCSNDMADVLIDTFPDEFVK